MRKLKEFSTEETAFVLNWSESKVKLTLKRALKKLKNLVAQEGYTVNSVGVTPSPYTIEISLFLKDSTLKQATDDLDSKITNYLYENGYDEFKLTISEATEVPQDQSAVCMTR